MTPREIYNALRYQLAPVGVTTIGPCANGCGNSARGGGQCAICLTGQLYRAGYNSVMGGHAWDLERALNMARKEILAVEAWLEAQEKS